MYLRDSEKLYIYPLVSFWVGVIAAILLLDDSMVLKDYVVAGTTLLAAFIGATLAFRLKDNKETRKEIEENVSALNFALFTLGRQINAIKLNKKYLGEYNCEFEQAFNLPAYKNNEYSDLKQDFGSLAFILESDESNVIFELTIEQECFEQAMDATKLRNEFYVNELQPLLSATGLTRRKVTLAEMEEVLGERVYQATIQGTKSMVAHVERCDRSLPKMHESLFALAKRMFPEHKFVKWEEKA